jgi:hypothetical protein
MALLGLGMPGVAVAADAITADGDAIDDLLKSRYRDVFDIMCDEPARKGTAPVGKMTKAEKKLAKKQRIKGRLAIRAAMVRVEGYFAAIHPGALKDEK